MRLKEIKHKQSLIELLKIEIGECYKRIQLYKKAEMEAFTSFEKFTSTEKEKIEDYDRIINSLEEVDPTDLEEWGNPENFEGLNETN